MKKVLLVLFILCSLNVFSQIGAKSRTVLKDFILGYDSESTIEKKGVNFNGANITEFHDNITIIRLDEFNYTKDVVLVFVKNTLYSVRYYVYTERQYRKYLDNLNKKYNILNHGNVECWFNEYVLIQYIMGEDDEPESFVHYDIQMLEKYPQFKDF